MTTRRALLTTVLSLLPLAAACGGGADGLDCFAVGSCTAGDPSPSTGDPSPSTGGATGGEFRGDGAAMPRFGGWAWGDVPADAVAKAGFEWFETGYPGDTRSNEILRNAGIRPFAYINLGELHDDLRSASGYSGPILRTNGDWGTYLVDVTHPSWQDWLVRRADEAYRTGSRGVKWDVATPDVPEGKSRRDVNDAMASVMRRILEQHPDMKFIFNQGFDFALAYPQYAHAVETEGLFSASTWASGWLQPWNDPYYWGPQFEQAKQLRAKGVPVIIAEYVDPWSPQARELYDAITAQGMVPYITNVTWNARGWGYNVNPGW